jgi:hypothetical protein
MWSGSPSTVPPGRLARTVASGEFEVFINCPAHLLFPRGVSQIRTDTSGDEQGLASRPATGRRPPAGGRWLAGWLLARENLILQLLYGVSY